ncbi:restriction endonuclease subunit S [Brevibacterium samyangense]|uniref:Restriction endonuclease subunit S n=1 Tax=Brevibacterium samyangense TaxID=366888 RepID=A0ABP5EI27_9MICO
MTGVREFVETGLEWLDRVPVDWTVAALGRECWVRARLGWKGLKAEEYVDEGGFPMLSTPDIKGHDIDFQSAARISEARFDESPEIALQVGDVLLTKDGSTIGTANIVRDLPEPTTLNGSIALLTPSRNLDGRYLYYVIVSRYAQAIFDRLRGGAGVPHLFQRDINRIRIPLPPLDEQRAIADYLDNETARIDALVAKQEEFISLLHERRGAVRDTLLTGGLVQGRGTESTGNAWLPELPRGWRAVPTRRLLDSGPSNGVSPEADRVGDLRSLSIGAVRNGRVGLADEVTKYVDSAAVRDISRLRLEPGDVLIVRGNGNISLVGRAGLVGNEFSREEFIYPDLLIRIRTTPDMLPEFFVAAFDAPTSRAQIELSARTTVGTFKISAGDVRSIVLPCPPLVEQRTIVENIDEQTSRIDALIAKAEEHIGLAKERRSALITAAVTGQIDVRTARKAS